MISRVSLWVQWWGIASTTVTDCIAYEKLGTRIFVQIFVAYCYALKKTLHTDSFPTW